MRPDFFTCFLLVLLHSCSGRRPSELGSLYYNTFYFSSDRPWNHWNSVKKHWKFTKKHWIFSVQCSPQICFLKKSGTAFRRHWISVIFSDFSVIFRVVDGRVFSVFQCFSVTCGGIGRWIQWNSVNRSTSRITCEKITENHWIHWNLVKKHWKFTEKHWIFSVQWSPPNFFLTLWPPGGGG
jgi:hypothetical protein